MVKKLSTISASEHAFIERKLEPVKDFNEVYRGTSKDFSSLIGYSLVSVEDETKVSKTTLLRMSVEQAVKQNYIIVIHTLDKLIIIDLLSANCPLAEIAKRYEEELIHHSFVYKTGRLSVDSNKMVTFSGKNSLNSLTAFIVKACGFVSDGNIAEGGEIIEKIIEKG